MDDVFRFLQLRAPEPRPTEDTIALVTGVGQPGAFQAELERLRAAGANAATVRRAADAFLAGQEFVARPDDLPAALGTMDQSAAQLRTTGRRISAEEFGRTVARAFGRQPAEVIAGNEFLRIESRLIDSLLALALSPESGGWPIRIVRLFKLCHLIRVVARGSWISRRALDLRSTLARVVVALPAHLFPAVGRQLPAAPAPAPPAPPAPAAVHPGGAPDIAVLRRARAELAHPRQVMAQRPVARHDVSGGNVATGLLRLARPSPSGEMDQTDPEDPPRVALPPESFDRLTPETRAVLTELGLTRARVSVDTAVRLLDKQIAETLARVQPLQSSHAWFVGGFVFTVVHTPDAAAFQPSPIYDAVEPPPDLYYAGQGILRLVRQELIAYELADIAHVENVLAGEVREREHRRLDRREETDLTVAEAESERETDLKSTERGELEAESQRQAELSVRAEGALKVSGSYGPSVDFEASASSGFSSTTQSATRTASRFAREVMQRAVERVKERTLRERRVIRLSEIEERNLHTFRNDGNQPPHVRGFYRFLNKIYRARVYTYDLRTMYEFVVPEPAAFFLVSLIQQQQSPGIDVPVEPAMDPQAIEPTGWLRLAAEYRAAGLREPPAPFLTVCHQAADNGQSMRRFTHAATVAIPDGYEAISAVATIGRTSTSASSSSGAGWRVSINEQYATGGKVDSVVSRTLEPARHSVAVGYRSWGNFQDYVHFAIHCRLTQERLDRWRAETFDTLLTNYRDARADYERAVAAAQLEEGWRIPGRNPLHNQRIIHDELKRTCLALFAEDHFVGLNAMLSAIDPGEWRPDFQLAPRHAMIVRFFESAFEWNNMSYVFYPYFWSRYVRWRAGLHQIDDPDPLFTAFLQAGAARVQVPVRPGFEAAVLRFYQDRTLAGADSLVIGTDSALDIIDEIQEQLGAPDAGVPDGEPWEVRVPTALVFLEDAGAVAGRLRDPLFGDQQGMSQVQLR